VIDGRLVHIEEPVTSPADEVVVALRPGIDPGRGPPAARFREQPKGREHLQHPVDRGAGHIGKHPLCRRVHLIGSGVVRPAQEGFKDAAALRGEPNAPLAARRFKMSDWILLTWRVHAPLLEKWGLWEATPKQGFSGAAFYLVICTN
jgi:hypothetical protein